MVVPWQATMRLLRANNRHTVRRGGGSGGVEHAGDAPTSKYYDETQPKEPAPSQVAVMFDLPVHTAIQQPTEPSVLDMNQVERISARSGRPRQSVL